MAKELEDLRAQLPELKSASHAARVVVNIGLDKLSNVEESIRKAAFYEGLAAGRAAFKKKLAAFFAEGPEE